MANKKAAIQASLIINVEGTEAAQKKIEKLESVVDKVIKDNKIMYTFDVNKSSVNEVMRISEKLTDEERNMIEVAIDSKTFARSLKKITDITDEQSESIRHALVNALKGIGDVDLKSMLGQIAQVFDEIKRLKAETRGIGSGESIYSRKLKEATRNYYKNPEERKNKASLAAAFNVVDALEEESKNDVIEEFGKFKFKANKKDVVKNFEDLTREVDAIWDNVEENEVKEFNSVVDDVEEGLNKAIQAFKNNEDELEDLLDKLNTKHTQLQQVSDDVVKQAYDGVEKTVQAESQAVDKAFNNIKSQFDKIDQIRRQLATSKGKSDGILKETDVYNGDLFVETETLFDQLSHYTGLKIDKSQKDKFFDALMDNTHIQQFELLQDELRNKMINAQHKVLEDVAKAKEPIKLGEEIDVAPIGDEVREEFTKITEAVNNAEKDINIGDAIREDVKEGAESAAETVKVTIKEINDQFQKLNKLQRLFASYSQVPPQERAGNTDYIAAKRKLFDFWNLIQDYTGKQDEELNNYKKQFYDALEKGTHRDYFKSLKKDLNIQKVAHKKTLKQDTSVEPSHRDDDNSDGSSKKNLTDGSGKNHTVVFDDVKQELDIIQQKFNGLVQTLEDFTGKLSGGVTQQSELFAHLHNEAETLLVELNKILNFNMTNQGQGTQKVSAIVESLKPSIEEVKKEAELTTQDVEIIPDTSSLKQDIAKIELPSKKIEINPKKGEFKKSVRQIQLSAIPIALKPKIGEFRQSIKEIKGLAANVELKSNLVSLRNKIKNSKITLSHNVNLKPNWAKLKADLQSDAPNSLVHVDLNPDIASFQNKLSNLKKNPTVTVELRPDFTKLKADLKEAGFVPSTGKKTTGDKKHNDKKYNVSYKKQLEYTQSLNRITSNLNVDNLLDKQINYINKEDVNTAQSFKEQIDSIISKAKELNERIKLPFSSEEEKDIAVNNLQNQLKLLKEISKTSNYLNTDKKVTAGILRNTKIDDKNIKDNVAQQLSEQYEEVSLSNYNHIKQTYSAILKQGDSITKATVQLKEYTDANNQAAVAVELLNVKVTDSLKSMDGKQRVSDKEAVFSADEKNILKHQIANALNKSSNTSKLLDAKINFLDKDEQRDVQSFTSKIQFLRDKVQDLEMQLDRVFDNNEERKQVKADIKEYVRLLNEATTAANQLSTRTKETIGNLDFGLDKVDKFKLQDSVMAALKADPNRKRKKIKLTDFNPNTKEWNAKWLEGKQMVQGIVRLKEYKNAANGVATSIQLINGSYKDIESSGKSWAKGLGFKLHNLTQYVTGIELVMRAVNQIRQGFAFVQELDKKLTTINQTMDVTKKELHDLGNGAINMGKDLKTSAQSVLEAVAIYANATETTESILEKARPTLMLANASGVDAATASDQVQGVVNQFNELEGKEREVVNTFERISAGLAVDFAKGINIMAEGVQTAGSVAHEAGLQFSDFAAMVGKVSEVTRQEGSQIGNAMKTIMARVSRNKSADEDVTDEDRSKASEAYASVGIQLYNDQGDYQDFGKTLDQLSAKWNTLTDAQRAYIAEASAGVRNVNVFNTMLKTYAESKDLAQAAREDANFIDETQEKYEESLAAKKQALEAQTQEFWNKLLDTEALNLALTLLTGIFDVASKIVGLFKGFGGIFGDTGAGIGGLIGTGVIGFGAYSLFDQYKKAGSIKEAAINVGNTFIEGLQQTFSKSKEAKNIFSTLFDKTEDRLVNASIATEQIGTAAKMSTVAVSGLTKAMIGIGAAVAAIGAVVWVVDTLHESAAELDDKIKTANKEYEKQQAVLKQNKVTIDSIGAEYGALSRGVSDTGENVSLTSKEFERYHEICNQIAEMYPQLIHSYDEQGNAILNLKGGVEALNAEYEKAAQYQSAEFWQENAETYISNYNRTQGKQGFWTQAVELLSSAFNNKNDTVAIYGEQYLIDNLKNAINMTNEEIIAEVESSVNALRDSWPHYLVDVLDASVSMTDEEFGRLRGKMSDTIQTLEAAMQQKVSSTRMAMNQYLSSITLGDGSRSGVDKNIVGHVQKMISNLPKELLDQFEDVGDVEQYVNNLLTKLSDNKEAVNILDKIYNLDGTESFDELKNILETQISELATLLGQDRNQLKIQLGLEDEEELVKAYDNLIEKAVGTEDELWEKAAQRRKSQLEKEFNELNKKSNIDYAQRQLKTPQDMYKAGWNSQQDKENFRDTDIVTTYTAGYTGGKHGELYIDVTPILDDGTILSPEELDKYVADLFTNTDANSILEADKKGKGIIAALFENPTTEVLDEYYKKAAEIKGEHAEIAKILNTQEKKAYKDILKSNKKIRAEVRKEEKLRDDIQDYLRDNNIATADEIELLTKCVEETDSWTEALNRFNIESINLEKNQEILDGLRKNIENVKEDINELSDAVEGSVNSMGMTSEQINKVVDAFDSLPDSAEFEYDKLFESTASGVHLNVQEMERLNGEYLKMQQGKYDDMLTKLQQQYRDTCVAITATTGAERNRHIATKEGLAEDIREIMELQSQFEGATSAVTNFFRAQSTTNEGSNYEKITKSIEDIENLYNKGLIGTDDFKSAVQMMTNEDLTGADSAKYLEVYQDKIDDLKRYFAEGQEGVRSFLDTLAGKGFASVDDKGIWSIDADIEEMAESLGLSQSLITEIFKRLNDYGFAIDFREESEYLKEFRLEAEKARATLDKKFQLNWEDADTVEKLETLIDTSDELRAELSNTFGEGSDQVKAFDEQVIYATAKVGEMKSEFADIGDITSIADLNSDLEKLNEYTGISISIDWSNRDPEYWTQRLLKLRMSMNELPKDINGKVRVDTEEGKAALRLYDGILQKQQELNQPLIMKVDVDAAEGVSNAQKLQAAVDELSRLTEASKYFKVDTSQAEANIITIVDKINDENPTMYAALNLDEVNLQAENAAAQVQEKMNGVTPEMLIEAGISEESLAAVEGYEPADETLHIGADTEQVKKEISDIDNNIAKPRTIGFTAPGLSWIKSNLDLIKDKTITITARYKDAGASSSTATGFHNVDGNVNFGGSAYANGNIGAPKDEVALVGEENPELRVNRQTGKWELLGEHGAEFAKINKGDLIFNADQTRELFKYGKVTSGGGRGRAFVDGTIGKLNSLFKVKSGTAYAKGSYVTNGAFHSNNKFYNGNYQSKAGKGADEFLETFD